MTGSHKKLVIAAHVCSCIGGCQGNKLISTQIAVGGLVRGKITVDGHPKVSETFRRVASYVEQV